jgi:hypothetical protein
VSSRCRHAAGCRLASRVVAGRVAMHGLLGGSGVLRHGRGVGLVIFAALRPGWLVAVGLVDATRGDGPGGALVMCVLAMRALFGDVADGDRLVAVWAETAEVDAGAGPVAVVAPLLAELAVVACGALAGGDGASGRVGRDCDGRLGLLVGMASSPGGLAAGWRAVALAPDRRERPRAARACRCRLDVVTPRWHGCRLSSTVGRWAWWFLGWVEV